MFDSLILVLTLMACLMIVAGLVGAIVYFWVHSIHSDHMRYIEMLKLLEVLDAARQKGSRKSGLRGW